MCFGGKKKEEEPEVVDVEQEEQEVEVKEAEKTEAVKAQEVKEAAMEEKAETFTAPVSTLFKDSPKRKRQKELSTGVEAPLTGDALAGAMTSMLGKQEGGPFEGPPSKAPKRKQKQMDTISALSKKRSLGKGRRSLITSTSGGGIGYYNKYFT